MSNLWQTAFLKLIFLKKKGIFIPSLFGYVHKDPIDSKSA